MKKLIQVVTTVETRTDADSLAALLIEKRLAACVQMAPCNSVYYWQGEIRSDNEVKLTIKSFAEMYPQLEKLILEHHPYDTPEILATAVEFVNQEYLNWMQKELIEKND